MIDDIASICEEVWPSLIQPLEDIGHSWTFDGTDNHIWCKDCDWYADDEFLEAVKLADQHRNEIKAAVLNLLAARLL